MIRSHLAVLLIALSMATTAQAQIPRTLSYQGLLQDAGGAVVPDGNYDLTFRLYDVASGGVALYTQAHSGGNAVPVVKGVFNVVLGSLTPLPLPFDRTYFLGITVGANPELTPRVPLTAAAYSLHAKAVEDSALVSADVAAGQLVRSLNGLRDQVTLAAGTNVTITPGGQTLTISATGGGGGLTLPFAGSTSSASDAFAVTNNGSGGALQGTSTSGRAVEGTSTTGTGLYGETGSTAAFATAIYGLVSSATPGGFSAAVRGHNNGASGAGIGVYGTQNGTGYGLFGVATGGTGGYGETAGGSASNAYGLWGRATHNAPSAPFQAAVRAQNLSTNDNGVGLHATHAGGGYGVLASSASGVGIYGETDAVTSGFGMFGVATSTAPTSSVQAAVRAWNLSTNSNGYGLWASHDGSGRAVYGTSANGIGVQGSGGAAPGVVGLSNSSAGVHGETFSTAAAAYGVRGELGAAVPGNGSAGVRGEGSAGNSNTVGVWGFHPSAGTGVFGQSTSGLGVSGGSGGGGFAAGVYGYSTAVTTAGVKANNSSATGTALEIQQGEFRVAGAGLNTTTAAFVAEVTTPSSLFTVNNPMCNDDPNAVLFVTMVGGSYSVQSVSFRLVYANGRWVVVRNESGSFSAGTRFNILVIKP